MPLVTCASGPVVVNWASIGNGVLIGDSIVKAVNDDATALAVLTAGGRSVTNIAVVGHTVAQQLSAWNALSTATRQAFTWAVVQFGVNNMAAGDLAADVWNQYLTALACFQAGSPSMRILISLMTPCKAYVGLSAGEFTEFQTLNASITGHASQRIRLCSAHYDLMSDGADNLAAAVDSGDDLHPNAAGSLIQAQQWRARLDADA
jgi:lysophospholipase L1-like esterase